MQLKLCFVLGVFTCLAVDAQNTVVAALQEASSQYNTAFARLSEIRDDCVPDQLGIYQPCGPAFAGVTKDIQKANTYLDTAAQLFVPKVNCVYITNNFKKLQENINKINAMLRKVACSTYPLTKAAAIQNAPALNSAISSQIPKIDRLGKLFAATPTACNLPQTKAKLQNFASIVKSIDDDDKKTAQAFTLSGETLGCIL